jgi:hypothetical protein
VASQTQAATRIWLWPNLLSLDAPVVALLWQVLFVRCFHASPGAETAILLPVAVWLIYAADRMLDAWRGSTATPRHQFYQRHWRAVVPVWVAILAAGTWIAWAYLPPMMWSRGLLVASGSAVYLLAVHGAPRIWRRPGAKEAAVGVVFALGVSLAAWPMVQTWSDIVAIALFCLLCWINCTAIEDWEHGLRARTSVIAGAALVALVAVIALRDHRPVIACAETASALGLVALDRWTARLSPDAARVLADVALLSPILFLNVAGTIS